MLEKRDVVSFATLTIKGFIAKYPDDLTTIGMVGDPALDAKVRRPGAKNQILTTKRSGSTGRVLKLKILIVTGKRSVCVAAFASQSAQRHGHGLGAASQLSI